jgi:Ca2+:H+ antiporter
VLLISVPLALIGKAAGWPDATVLVLSLIALCPLAERISFVTEELAQYTNDTLGGLLSATMGNMTELIVSIFALQKGLLRVVQVSLIGSIFGNLLLVLGCAFLVGGIRFPVQKYNKHAAMANSSLLMLAVMGLIFPVALTATHEEAPGDTGELRLSRLSAVVMLLCYITLIIYQLRTHTHLFEGRDDDDDPEEPVLGPGGAFFWAAVITVFISIISEYVVETIESAAVELQIPILFIATILLPIVGNAAEHFSAIVFAHKNRMDISLGIAVGSATQISLFVIPLSVVVGWMIGQPLSLDFKPFETVVLFVTVAIVSSVINTGRSDWLKGMLFLAAYSLVAASFWLHGDDAALNSEDSAQSTTTTTPAPTTLAP